MQRFLLLVAVTIFTSPLALTQDVGAVTLIRDNTLRVIRGYSVLKGAEGMHLRQGDILETGSAETAQAQLEFSSGAIIELGPSSKVFLFRPTGSPAEIVLLSGWLKGETTSGSYAYASGLMSATSKGGNVLLHSSADAAEAFIERGAASISTGASPGATSSVDKVFFTRRAGKPVAATGRPSQEFINAMPLSFRDQLPPRLSRFTGLKSPEPKSDHDVSFVEVEPWLRMSPDWRRGFVARFRPRLQDKAFHQAIEAHLAALPDWESVLHPENH